MTIVNGSFETGDFSNWDTIGDTGIRTQDLGVFPTDGVFQAILSTGGIRAQAQVSVSQSNLEEFLGIAPGLLDNFGNGNVSNLPTGIGSAIQQTFTANTGDLLTFNWNFLTNEQTLGISLYNDFAFFTINKISQELADTNFPIFTTPSTIGFSQQTGYQTLSIGISETGTYNLGFGVVDVTDSLGSSALLIDSVTLTTI